MLRMLDDSSSESSSSDALQAFERYERERNKYRQEVQELIAKNQALFLEDKQSEHSDDSSSCDATRKSESRPSDGYLAHDDFYNPETYVSQNDVMQKQPERYEQHQDSDMVLYEVYKDEIDVDHFIAEKTQMLDYDVYDLYKDEISEHYYQDFGVYDQESAFLTALDAYQLNFLRLANAKRRQFRVIVKAEEAPAYQHILQTRLSAIQNRYRIAQNIYSYCDDFMNKRKTYFMEMWKDLRVYFADESQFYLLEHRNLVFTAIPAEAAENAIEDANAVVIRGDGVFNNALIAKISGIAAIPWKCTRILQLTIENATFSDNRLELSNFASLLSVYISKTNLLEFRITTNSLVELSLQDNHLVFIYVSGRVLNALRLAYNRLAEMVLDAPLLQVLQLDYNSQLKTSIRLSDFQFLQHFSCYETYCSVELSDAAMLYLEHLSLSFRVPVELSLFTRSFFPSLRSLEVKINESHFSSSFLGDLCELNTVFPRIQVLNFENSISALSSDAIQNLVEAFPQLQLFQRESVKYQGRFAARRYCNSFVFDYLKVLKIIEFQPFPGRLFNYQRDEHTIDAFALLARDLQCDVWFDDKSVVAEPFMVFKPLYFAITRKKLEKRDETPFKAINKAQSVYPAILQQLARLRALYRRRNQFVRNAVQESRVFSIKIEARAAIKIQNEYKRICACITLKHVFASVIAREKIAAFAKKACVKSRISYCIYELEALQTTRKQAKQAYMAEIQGEINYLYRKLEMVKDIRSRVEKTIQLGKRTMLYVNAARRILRAMRSLRFSRYIEARLATARHRICAARCMYKVWKHRIFATKLQERLYAARKQLSNRYKSLTVAQVAYSLDDFDFYDDVEIGNEFNMELPYPADENLQEFLEQTLRLSAPETPQRRTTTPPILGQLCVSTDEHDVQIVGSALPYLTEKSRALRAAELYGWTFQTEEAAESWYRAQLRAKKTKKVELTATERYKRLIEKRRQ